MSIERKEYLGDGVYARIDSLGDVVLTTENGIRATNSIVLDRDVLLALVRFLKSALTSECGSCTIFGKETKGE